MTGTNMAKKSFAEKQRELSQQNINIFNINMLCSNKNELDKIKEKEYERQQQELRDSILGDDIELDINSQGNTSSYVDRDVKNGSYFKASHDNKNAFDFFLMHRSSRVALVRMLIAPGKIKPLRIKVINKSLLPVVLSGLPLPEGFVEDTNEVDQIYRNFLKEFSLWYENRLIPEDRVGIDNIITPLTSLTFNTTEEDQEETLKQDMYIKNLFEKGDKRLFDKKYYLMFLSLLSYGRNMSDKYWFNPVNLKRGESWNDPFAKFLGVNFTSKDNLFYEYGLNISVRDSIIYRKKDYSGMDFTKNGFTNLFSLLVDKKVIKRDSPLTFNTPDFCTSGTVSKKFAKEKDVLYLEKYYNDTAAGSEKAKLMMTLNTDLPEVFPVIFPIIKELNEKKVLAGYKTEVFVDGFNELADLKDVLYFIFNSNFLDIYGLESRDSFVVDQFELFLKKTNERIIEKNKDEIYYAAIISEILDDDAFKSKGFLKEFFSQIFNVDFESENFGLPKEKNVAVNKRNVLIDQNVPNIALFMNTAITLLEKMGDVNAVSKYLLENTGFTYSSTSKILNRYVGW